jgi:hypothetical protein
VREIVSRLERGEGIKTIARASRDGKMLDAISTAVH